MVGTLQVEMRKGKHEKLKSGEGVHKMGGKSHENSHNGKILICQECPLFIVKPTYYVYFLHAGRGTSFATCTTCISHGSPSIDGKPIRSRTIANLPFGAVYKSPTSIVPASIYSRTQRPHVSIFLDNAWPCCNCRTVHFQLHTDNSCMNQASTPIGPRNNPQTYILPRNYHSEMKPNGE